MNSFDQLRQENSALRERISALCTAMLRISASLELETVLHHIAESARALTGAACAIITTVDAGGKARDSVFSGFTPDARTLLESLPDASSLFGHFRDLPGPTRLTDVAAYIGALGYPVDRIRHKTFLATPVRHQEVHVGNFFLGDKEGGAEFTSEDEEILALFASQAATAIVNARTYRAEQRARADLEALIETSPVGVAVLDPVTGSVLSFNREARRIVGALLTPGQAPEQLFDAMTCRLADGRELALDPLTLIRELKSAATMRGEEIVLSSADGRSVTVLINATPIRSDDGEVQSVVVTMQDLADLQELDRLRAEFLAMVSHELRAPLAAIKGSAATLLRAESALDPAEMHEFFRIIDEHAESMRSLIADLLDAGRIDSGTLSISPQATVVAALVDLARKTFLNAGGRHGVVIDLPPDLPPVMADRRRIVQVLNNLLANAARFSPVSTSVFIGARLDGAHVAISVADQGKGIAPERRPHVFRKYSGEDGTGGGLGLAICKGLVEAHGGRIWAEPGDAGRGTRFTFTVPVAGEAGEASGEDVGGRPESASDGLSGAPILVVDDDPQTLRYVRDTLADAGYTVLVTGEPEDLSRIVRKEQPQLILLDLVLPGTDGIELMRYIPELAGIPVMFISAYGRDETIARALQSGAADYIVKPFSPTELTARVRAVLRRRADPDPFMLGDLVIDYGRHEVSVAGRRVDLTATEFELLRVLSVNTDRVLTHESLLRQVWNVKDDRDPEVVRAFVKTLRRKLGDSARYPAYIHTVRGTGYRMARPDRP